MFVCSEREEWVIDEEFMNKLKDPEKFPLGLKDNLVKKNL